MLCISRRLDQIIEIGPDIRVQIQDINGGQVQLGIEAPPHIGVWRGEVPMHQRRRKPLPPPIENGWNEVNE